MPVPSHESEQSCICVLGGSILPLSTIFLLNFWTVWYFVFFHFILRYVIIIWSIFTCIPSCSIFKTFPWPTLLQITPVYLYHVQVFLRKGPSWPISYDSYGTCSWIYIYLCNHYELIPSRVFLFAWCIKLVNHSLYSQYIPFAK